MTTRHHHRIARRVDESATGLADIFERIGNFFEDRRINGAKQILINLSPRGWEAINTAFPDKMSSQERRKHKLFVQELQSYLDAAQDGFDLFLKKEKITPKEFEEIYEECRVELEKKRTKLQKLAREIEFESNAVLGLEILGYGPPEDGSKPTDPQQETATEEAPH